MRRAVEWTLAEDRVLARLQEQLGNQWSQISQQMPGRSEAAVKSHWNAVLKKRLANPAPAACHDQPSGHTPNYACLSKRHSISEWTTRNQRRGSARVECIQRSRSSAESCD